MSRDLVRLLSTKDCPSPRELPEGLPIWDLDTPYGRLRDIALVQGIEWGACLERFGERLGLVHEVKGTVSSVTPSCLPLSHAPYLGFAHVHVPLKFKMASFKLRIAYIGFSDRDYRASLEDGERMSLVTNGDEVFAIVRTNRTPSVSRFFASDFDKWASRYDDALNRAKREMAKARVTNKSSALNHQLLEVNERLCQDLQFGFYAAEWGRPLQLIYQPREETG